MVRRSVCRRGDHWTSVVNVNSIENVTNTVTKCRYARELRSMSCALHLEFKCRRLTVILGKYYADYERNDNLTQIKTIKEIVMLAAYQDKTGNYGSDLAVLILSSRVEFSAAVRPVCIDWELDYIDQDLSQGSVGTVAGWGVNENDTFSDKLYKVQLPVVPDQTCITQQSRDFKKYITYTTFCAGYNNGTGVCNGDSGGGLMFSHNGTWTLQGVVSVSPRRRGTSFCDPTKYTIFTKVAMYAKWIKYVLDSNHIN
ncbi:hypothetical protein L9F63_025765 [Diploptera punctata]|uniref:Peptidase S1 domain-containing protein n=1 Tax=Diploptera punctata TaxID=6984 RepID=A0AAD7Z7Z8_DIPPU|nr:hypothetical protein L9F63_025765 [Diploptera punctata]